MRKADRPCFKKKADRLNILSKLKKKEFYYQKIQGALTRSMRSLHLERAPVLSQAWQKPWKKRQTKDMSMFRVCYLLVTHVHVLEKKTIYTVFSVAIRNRPWTEIPAPPPMTMPFKIEIYKLKKIMENELGN